MKRTMIFLLLFTLSSTMFAQFALTQLDHKPIPYPRLRVYAVDSFNTSSIYYSKLPSASKEVLYYTNLARYNPQYFWDSVVTPILVAFPELKGKNAQSLLRDFKISGPLPMFSLHPKLINAAQFHSADLANTGTFSHSSSNGDDFVKRLTKFGVTNTYAAENISNGQQAIVLSIVLLYLDIGIADLGHRKTLLSKQYSLIGLGYATHPTQGFFITQDFSSTIE